MNTLVIPFVAHNVSLRSTPHIMGTPSATAISGFGHAVCRLIKDSFSLDIEDQGAALAINRYSFHVGRPKHALATKADAQKARDRKMASMVDERVGTLRGAVVLRFESSPLDSQALASRLDELKEFLHLLRFAGGHLEITHKLAIYQEDDGEMAFRSLPGYFRVIVDRTPWISAFAEHSKTDNLEALLGLLLASENQMRNYGALPTGTKAEDGQEQASVEPVQLVADEDDFAAYAVEEVATFDPESIYLGRLIPIDIGYRLIEQPQERNTGMPYLHAYAEPVLGVARLQALSSYRKSKEGFSAFWVHQAQENTYIAQGAK